MKHFPVISEASLKNHEAIRVAATIFIETLEKHLPHDELYVDDGGTRYGFEQLTGLISDYLALSLSVEHCASGTCGLEEPK